MARQQSKAQQDTIGRVMHEFKHGELRRGRGGKVKNPKQAIAIALNEAGASKFQSKEQNLKNLQRTKTKERAGRTGKAAAEGRGGRKSAQRLGARKTKTRRSAGSKR
jgi:hypothetical protein